MEKELSCPLASRKIEGPLFLDAPIAMITIIFFWKIEVETL